MDLQTASLRRLVVQKNTFQNSFQCVHKIAQMEGRSNLLDLKFAAGNGEVTDVNDVDYCVHDPAMAGVHDYNSARQVVDSPYMSDLIEDDSGDFI